MTRGASQTRVTDMLCSNVVSHSSIAPLTGAAEPGSGEHASGMWPSPASRPEVGSGEVDLGTARAVQRFDVALELDQVAGDETRGQAEMA